MNTLETMFDNYIKMYGLDATVNDITTIRLFFKEIKDNNSQDKKYCYAYLNAINQGDVIKVGETYWLLMQEDESIVHGKYTRLMALRLFLNINLAIDSFLYSTMGQIITGSQGNEGTTVLVSDGKIVINVPMNEIPNTVAKWEMSFSESNYDISLDSENTINPIVTKNGQVVLEGYTIEWASSDESIITVDANGAIVPDTFTITASGLPTNYYVFTSGTNSFSVKNKYGYADGFTVTCVSNSTGESVSIVIGFRN